MRVITSLTQNHSVAKAIAVNPNSQATSLLRRRAQLFLLLIALLMSGMKGWGQTTSIYESYAILNINSGGNTYYDLNATTANTDFNNANLGTFLTGTSTLVFAGGENKTSKCSGGNVTGGNIYYRVYLSSGSGGGFTTLAMSFVSNDAGGCGGNQTWRKNDGATNIISGLAAGAYTLEVYSDAPGSPSTAYASNSGANYKASFTVVNQVYSKSTGNLETLSNWGTNTDGTGTAPANFTTAGVTYNIRNNATPTIGANWTVSGSGSKIIVGDGTNACNFTVPGALTVTSPATDVSSNGTITRTTSGANSWGTLTFASNAKYVHNASGGTLPTATWNSNSTLQIDANLAADQFTQSFGNVIVNNTAAFFISTTSATYTGSIQGNFTHNSSGAIALKNNSFDATFTIGGGLSITGGGTLRIMEGIGTSLTKTHKIVVNGSFSLSSGTLNLSNETGTTSTASALLEVKGNFTHTGGTISETATSASLVTRITLTGTSGTQTFESTGQTGSIDFNVAGSNAQCVVSASKTFVLSSTATMTIANGTSAPDLLVDGTFRNAATPTVTGTITFSATGTYEHNFTTTAGTIPTATWSSGSTCSIIGYTSNTSATGGIGQSFSNFTWNCANQAGNINLSGGLTTINGNYTITSTGASSELRMSGATAYALTIGGNFSIAAGIIDLSNGAGNVTWNIAGNFSQSGGTFKLTGSGTKTINFNKSSGTQTFTQSAGTISNAISFNVGTGSSTNTVQLGSNVNLGSGTGTFTVLGNATFDAGTNVLSGSAASTFNSGANIITANTGGVNGSITLSGTRTYNAAANYTYNNSTPSAQVTGAAVTAANNITINNSAGVTLSTGTTVSGALTLSSGRLAIGSNTLTLNGTVASMNSTTNNLTGSSTSNLTIGGTGTLGTLFFDQTTAGTTNRIAAFTINRTSSGTATLGNNLVISGAATFTAGLVAIGANTLTLNGTVASMSATGCLTGSASSNLTIGGTGALGTLFFDQTTAGTTNQIAAFTINRITSGTATLGNNLVISGAATFTAGLVAIGANTLTLNGTVASMSATGCLTGSASSNLTIGGTGALGTLFFDPTTAGTTNQIAAFTINRTSSGTATLGNNLVISGAATFTAGLVAIGANTLTLNGTVASMSATGCLTGSSSSNLSIGGTGALGTLFFDQTTTGTTNSIATLTLNRTSSGTVNLGNDATIGTSLTLTAGLLSLGSSNLLLGGTATIGGTPSASNMVVATGSGELRKIYTGTGTFTFPVGDATATTEYSPATLNFTGGTFSASSYAGVKLSNSKYSPSPGTTDFINRYWSVSTSGITGSPVCTASFVYVDADINGTEGNLYGGRYLSSTWNCLDAVTTSTNTISKAGITAFGDFTAGEFASVGCCINPTSGGTIAADQTVCLSGTPAAFTSTAVASGNGGTLEYKWQSSTTSSSAGFSDISSTNSATYTPSSISQTTWYKRLARVTCKSDWTGAAESNVLVVSVDQSNAAASTYNSTWSNSQDDAATGLSAWSLATTGTAGFFTGSSDINVSSKSWGMYANTGGLADATRPFASNMTTGTTLNFSIDNGTIQSGGTVGFGLRNSSGQNLMEFYSANGGTYTISDATSTASSGVAFTTSGLDISISYTAANTYSMSVTPSGGGTTVYFTGRTFTTTGSSNQVPRQIRFFNANAGSGSGADYYVNKISLNRPAIGGLTNFTTQSVCLNGAPNKLSVAAYGTGLSYQWYSSASSTGSSPTNLGSTNGAQTSELTPQSSSAGTLYYYCVVTGTCSSVTSNVSGGVTVIAAADAGTLSGGQTICASGGTTTFSSTVSGGTWSNTGTAGVASINATTGVITPVAAGTTTMTYTVAGSGGCADGTATRTITVDAVPTTANAGADQSVCAGTTITLGATPVSLGSGAWSVVTGSGGSFTSSSSATSTFTGTTGTTYTLRWTTTNGTCTLQDDVDITIKNGTLTFVNLNTASASVCAGVNFTPSGRVYQASLTEAAGAGSGIEAEFGYSASNSDPSGWSTWTSASYSGQGGTGNNDDVYDISTGLSLAAGTYYYTFRYRRNGCSWVYAGYSASGGGTWNGTTNISGVLTVNANPTVNAGSALSGICQSGISASMGGSVGGSATGGTWTGGGGSWTNASNPSTATYTASATESGVITLTLTTSGGSCGTTSTTKTIVVTAAPSAGTLSGTQSVCVGGTTQFNSTAGGGSWTSSDELVATVNSSGLITAVAAGTATITYTVAGSGGCSNTSATRSVTVTNTTTSIAPSTTQNITINSNGSQLTVTAGTNSVTGRQWGYRSVSGTGAITDISGATSANYTPNFGTAGTYYVVCRVSYGTPCSTTITSNEVVINVVSNSITTGTISGSSFCAGATGVSVPFTYAAAGNFPSATFKAQLSNASGSFASPVDLQTVASDASGSQSISVTIPSNTAEGTGYRIRVVSDNPALNGTDNGSNLTVNVASVGGSIAGGTTVCTGTNSTGLTLSGQIGSVTKWQSSTASDFSASVTDISNTTTSLTATNLTATTYYRAVVTNGACSAANSSSATITVSAASVGGTVSGGSAICLGSTSAQLSLSGNTGSVTKWQSSPSPYTTWTDISNTSTTYTSGALSQTTQFRAVVTNGACSAANSSATTVTVDQSNADASAYGSSWASSSNDAATGLNSWVLLTSGTSGHFVGNSNIDVNSKSWGMYANTGGEANAIRPFTNNMSIGTTLNFSIDNGTVQSASPTGVVGFGLRNSSSANLMEFYFTGGSSFYTINDNAGASLTSVPYTTSGLNISITYTAANTYSMSVTPAAGGTTTYFTGRTFIATGNQVPREVRFFNFNAGSGGAADYYVNSLSLNRTAIGAETNFGAQTLCKDATPNTLSVTAYGSGLTYQWYQNTSASISGASSIPSANSSSYTPSTSSAGTLYYYCIVSGTCSSVRSNFSGAVTVSGTPTTANAGPDQSGSATCGLTSVTLAANTPTVGTGAWSIVSGAGGTITTPSSPTSTFTGTAGTTYTLRWTITSSPCSASTDDVVITFNQNPTTANAGADQTGSATCGLTSVTLAGNTPTVGTGAWSIVSGTGGTITSPSSATSTFTGTAGSTYTLRWTISNSPCTASTDDVVIAFNQNPTTANAGADQTGSATCGQTSVTLAGNTPTVGTGAWTIVSGTGGSLGDASSPTSSFSGTAGVTYTLRWTISSGSCTASTDDVDIAFNQNPTTANAGADQTGSATCGQSSVTLAGNTPTVGTGAWSIVSGAGGTITTPSSPTSTFTGTAGTTYTLRWTISNNPCTASTDDVVITFNQSPTAANAGADQIGSATCGSTSITLSANTPTVGTGAWTIVSGTGGSFDDASSPTSTFNGTAGTTYTLRWTISNSPCTASSDDVTIALNQNPAAANAGADQTDASTCGLTSVTLAANTPSTGSGVWSIVSGTGGTITTPSSPTSTFSGTAGSTYTLRWTINNSPCTASTDDVIITFNQNPTTANAGADQTGAATCGLTSVMLAGNTPTVGSGSWSIITGTGGTVTSPSSPTSTFTGTAGSTYTLRWSISNGSCTASTDDVLVAFNQNPTTANAGPDQNVCSGASATLAANTPTVGTGAWTVVSGAGGSFGNASSPTSTFSGTTGTTYTLRWTISNSPCTASTDDVVITVSGAVNYGTVSGVNTNDHLVISQVYGGGGNSSATYTNDFVEIFNPTSSAVSVTNWKIQYASSAGSYADAATLSGTINPGKYYLISLGGGAIGAALPTADATGSTNLSGSTGKVRLINASSTVIDKLGYGTSSSPDPEGTAETSASGNVVSYQRVNNGCTDTDNNANDFTNNTTANARNSSSAANVCGVESETICSGSTPSSMSVSGASGSGSFTYQWYYQTGAVSTPTGSSTIGWTTLGSTDGAITATYTPTSGLSTTTTYACFVTPGGSPSCGTGTWASGSRTVYVNTVSGGTVASNLTICSGGNPAAFTTSVAASAAGTLTYQWESSTASNFASVTTIGGATSATYDAPAGLTTTTFYRLKATSVLNGVTCSAYSNVLTVTVNAAPTVTGTTSVCVGLTTQLSGSGTPSASSPWSSNSANATVNSTGLVTGVTAGTATITYTDVNGCQSAGTTVTVNALPTVSFTASPAATLCSATSATYTTQSGQSNYIWSVPGTLNTDYTIASGGLGTSSNTVTINWLTAGSKTVTVNYTNSNNCTAVSPASSTTTVTITPTTSNAGVAQSICSNGTATLAANTPSVGTGAWTVTSGPSTTSAQFSSTSNPGAVFTPAGGAGSYVLTWTISNGSCTSSSTVTITVNAIPATTGVTICQGGSGSLAATDVCSAFVNSGTTFSGTWATTPTAFRPTASIVNKATCDFSTSITRNYTATQFQVSTTGSYTFEMDDNSAFDGMAYLTSGSFTPGNCTTGTWIRGDDDGGTNNEPLITASLTAGVTYTMYSTTYSGSSGTYTGSFSWTVTPPSGGQIMLNNNAVVNWYTASSGGSVIGTGTSFNPVGVAGSGLANTNTAGTYTYYAACSNSTSCRAAADFIIKDNPTTANAGSDQTGSATCGQTTATLAANTPTVGTGEWSIVSGTGGAITTPSSPTSTFTGVAGSTYVLRWTISNSPCSNSSDEVTITFNRNPTTADAGPDQLSSSTCGSTQVTLAANTPTIGTGLWSIVSGTGGSFGNASSPTSTFNGTAGVTYTLRWTISNSPCTASTDDVQVSLNLNPPAANAGADQTGSATCGLTSVTLAATTPSYGTGTWSVVSGSGGSFGDVNSPTSTFSGTAGVSYTLRWTINNSPCTASTDDVIITFNVNPTLANAGADQAASATCGLTTVTLAGNVPTTGTGSWSVVSGTGGSFGNAISATSTFSGTAGSSYALRWTITNGACSSSDDMLVIFNQNPTTANAGPDQTGLATCSSTQITLAANTPTIGSGSWSIVSGAGGSFGSSNSPSSTFSGIAGETYTLRWTITNSPCTSSTDDVVITLNQAPTTANAGPDQTGAATCGQTSVTLAGNTPSVGSGAWSIVSGTGGTITTPSSPTSTFSGTAGSSYTLRWTISNSPCSASTDDVMITFNQNPTTANAGADQTGSATCGLTSVTLAANTPTVGTGSWSVVSGSGGSFGDASSPTSTFSGTSGVTYTLRWTISNTPCTSSSDDIVVSFNQNPSGANAGADQTGSATCGLTSVTLAATPPAIGSGTWSIISGAGGSLDDANSPISSFSGTAGTTYTLRWTVSNASCTATTDDMVVTFNRNPTTANAGADQTGSTTCGLTSVTLAANSPAIGTGSWSIVSGIGGSFSNSTNPSATFSGTAGSTYTLRWTISNSPCTASTDDVVITFNKNPTTANAGADQTGSATCNLTEVTLAGNEPVEGTGSWSVVSGSGGSIGDVNSATSTFTGTAGVTYTLRWTISNSPCTASTDDVVVTFNVNPTPANAGTDITQCGSTTFALSANSPSVGTGAWSVVSGSASFSNASLYNTNATLTSGSSAVLRWTITNGSCTSTDDVEITYDPGSSENGTWKGTASSDWDNPANWGCNTLPNSSANIVIEAGASNYPVFNSTQYPEINSLTINTGATFTMTGSSTLTINSTMVNNGTLTMSNSGGGIVIGGNWNNNGTVNPGASTLTFNGSGVQTLGGSVTTQPINNLVVNKPGQTLSLINVMNLNVSGDVTLTAGQFITSGITNINMSAGNWTNNGGTFTPGGSTIVFNGTSNQEIGGTTSAEQLFANITMNKASGSLTFATDKNINVSGNLNLTQGTLTPASGSTVAFDKPGNQNVPTANYYHLKLSKGGTKELANNTAVAGDLIVENPAGGGTTTVTPGNVIKFNGNNNQNIAGLAFNKMEISGTGGFTKRFTSNASIDDAITFEGGTGTVDLDGASNNLLFTVKSTASATARVGNIGSWSVTGKAVVERYVPSQRKWRLISVPTVPGETLRQALTRQIDGSYPNPVCFTADAQAGSGTLITGHSMSSCTNATSVGFDHLVSGGASSIRFYNSGASNPWNSATSTPNVLAAPTQSGYLAFIRGDRQTLNSGSSVTTLRPKGDLIQGNYNIPYSSRFFVLGNPYASPISFESLYEFGVENGNATKIKRTFWIWDANLTNSTGGVGGYRVVAPNDENVENPSYTVTPALPGGTTINDYLMINSGQAILVERRASSGAGNVVVKESHKLGNNGNLLNLRTSSTDVAKIKVDMYRANGSTLEMPMDGVVARFAEWYDAEPTDNYDVYKNNQFEENLSIARKDNGGVIRYLSIESRPAPTVNDTIFMPFYQMSNRGYALKFNAENMASAGLNAYLQDQFTATETEVPLSGSDMIYPFSVTADANSKALSRFRIVFRPSVITDVVDWMSEKGISIYPNPVVKGTDVQVQFRNSKSGKYDVTIYSLTGVRVMQTQVVHPGGSSVQKTTMPAELASGTYIMEFTSPNGDSGKTKLIVQ